MSVRVDSDAEPPADSVVPLDDETDTAYLSAPDEIATHSSKRGLRCPTVFRSGHQVLRGRKRVLLSTASFIALLVLYYVYVLPALWPCSNYFTLMLLFGIIEGMLLFFAAIWRAYTSTSSHSSRRRSPRARRLRRSYSSDASFNTTTDEDLSETDRSDYYSDGIELEDRKLPATPPQPPPPPPQSQSQPPAAAVSSSGMIGAGAGGNVGGVDYDDYVDDDDDDDDEELNSISAKRPSQPSSPVKLPPHRRRARGARRRDDDSDALTTEDDLDDNDATSAPVDDDAEQNLRLLVDSEPLSLGGEPRQPLGSGVGARQKEKGVWKRCVALRARHVSFNFCLTLFGVVNAIVILALVSAVLYIRGFTLPVVSGRLTVAGLLAPAFIERDTNGVIHVRADNEHDLFFAQGFVSAQERLFQLEFQRRLGAGRLSERLGNATISLDRYFRTLGLRRAAELSLPLLSKSSRDAIEAFVEGINAFLATEPPLPIEFGVLEYLRSDIEPFTVVDVVQWSKVMAYDLSNNMHEEMRRFELARNVSAARMAQFFPDYDTAAFPTVVEGVDLRDDLLAAHVAQVRAAAAAATARRGGASERRRSSGSPGEALGAGAARRFVGARYAGTDDEVPAPKFAALERLLQRFAGWRHGARASNNWAVHGQHTRSGRPLLANDPHLGLSTPAIWLLIRLQCPTISAIGAAFPSSPGVILGRNDYIAWGVTNLGTDVQDLFVLDTINATAYMHNGEPRAFVVRNETIVVKRPLLLQEPYRIELTIRESVHGPVLSDHIDIAGADSRAVALRWLALDAADSSINAFDGIQRAQNWSAFRDAVSKLVTPASNFVYADVSGNIGYQASGAVPVRVAGHDGRAPVSGNGTLDWLGVAPFSTLPFVLNPQSGYVVSANNRVSPPAADASLLLNNGDWGSGYRARRISEMLRQKRRLSVDDMKAMQTDLSDGLFDDLAPLIGGLLKTNLLSDRERKWLNQLSVWDGLLTVQSREGTVFLTWVEHLLDSARAEMGDRVRPSTLFVHYTFGRFVDGELPFDAVCLADLPPSERTTQVSHTAAANATAATTAAPGAPPMNDACVRFAARSFSRALQQLFDNWSDVVALGKRQQVVFEHPVLKGTQLGCFYERHSDVGGSPWTVNPSGGVLHGDAGSVRKANHGASYRQIVDFGDFSQSVFVSTLGQGEQPMSPFFDSFLEKWLTGGYVPMMQQGVYASLQLTPDGL